MNKELVNQLLDDIHLRLETIRREVNRVNRITTVEALEKALLDGGELNLETAIFDVKLPTRIPQNTKILGNGATIVGLLYVNEDDGNIALKDLELKSSGPARSLLRLGNNVNGAQTLDRIPRNILLDKVHIKSHRGRTAIEVNSDTTWLQDCVITDVYDPAGTDSQAVVIQNTPGNFQLLGGHYEAASENLLVGGDDLRLGTTRRNIYIGRATFIKPLEWMGKIPIKNLIELKDGWGVLIEECALANCWVSGQTGYAFVFTPVMGGQVQVEVRNCNVKNVVGVALIGGVDKNGINTTRTQVRFEGGKFEMNAAELGGTSRFALMTGGPEEVIINGVDVTATGDLRQFVYVGDTKPVDRLYITNSKFPYGTYGVSIAQEHHGANTKGIVKDLIIKGNTISGAKDAFKKLHPENIYV